MLHDIANESLHQGITFLKYEFTYGTELLFHTASSIWTEGIINNLMLKNTAGSYPHFTSDIK